MFKNVLYIVFVGLITQSCNYFKPKQDQTKELVAKVYDAYLYKEDIKTILPKEYTKNDSSLLVANYINSWAKQQLLVHKANINLKEEQVEIEQLVTKYKEDLLINKYKEAVVSQELDTVILTDNVSKYYETNKEIFKLNEQLIQFRYLKIAKNLNEIKAIKKLFFSKKKEDFNKLVEQELTYKSFHFNDTTWIKYNDALKFIPQLNDFKKRIKSNAILIFKDTIDLYLIKINKVLKRNEIAPKEYVEPTIKQMILHNRKLLLVKDIEKTLLNDATKNGKYEIYK